MSMYNIDSFAESLGLELDDVAELYKAYIIDADKFRRDLLDAYYKKEWDSLEKVVHGIKGAAGNINIKDVYAEAALYHEKLKRHDMSRTSDHVKKLICLIDGSIISISDFFEEKNIRL